MERAFWSHGLSMVTRHAQFEPDRTAVLVSRAKAQFRCQGCGAVQARWAGRCPTCGEWNCLEEERLAPPSGPSTSGSLGGTDLPGVQALYEVDMDAHPPLPTGVSELDRVLAGGLVPGSATLVGGEPGTGKSTLLLQALAGIARSGRRCLLVAAEEAAHQVRRRAARLGADVPGVYIVEATSLPAVLEAMRSAQAQVVVVDSVQAVSDPELGSPAGSPAQVRVCANNLVGQAKALGVALMLVGHVTKDGTLAGPRALEHLVDTVLSFEGDRYLALRSLRAVKHRFGPTGETGLFEMGEAGLSCVADPSALFLGDRLVGAAGSAVTVTMEGHRPLLVEVQALVGRSCAVPRRLVTGADPSRVGFLAAVLDCRAEVKVGSHDIYVSVAGGAQACEPAADLAVCLAIASSFRNRPVPGPVVAVGEVGLGGELRRVPALAKRLAEAERLGFDRALVPGRRQAHGGTVTAGRVTGGQGCANSLAQAIDMTLGRCSPCAPASPASVGEAS